MFKDKIRKYWYVVVGGIVVFVAILLGPILVNVVLTSSTRYDLSKTSIQSIPHHHIGLVFGAGIVRATGQPTPYLRSRIETGVQLYKAHRVDKLLMSGDNSSRGYNEPDAMRKYAVTLGVPASDVVEDYAGYSTYDSCYRARHIFNVTDAIVVTQGYHLPRAMSTCSGLGVHNIGVHAVHTSRDFTIPYIGREMLSTDKMVIQDIFKPKPTVLGTPEPIQ